MPEGTFDEIVHGERVIFHDLKPADYWPTFDALKEGFFIGQYNLEGGLEVSALHPVIEQTSEQERLCRPTELKNGETKTISCKEILDNSCPSDADKLAIVRNLLREEIDRYPTDAERELRAKEQLQNLNLQCTKGDWYART